MPQSPVQHTLELQPRARYDVIDVRERLRREVGDALDEYPKALYCSFHTTAGYLEQSLCARLDYSRERLDPFIGLFRRIFPPEADYQHDRLDLRRELSEEQKRVEPKNADSHLAFIGSGLRNCVTYINKPAAPVYFIDLDGVCESRRRRRQTTVLAYSREEVVARATFEVPVSAHPVDSISLRDPRTGLMDEVQELIRRHGLDRGRVDFALELSESHAGLTVNEYETLLMRHDLPEVLRNPLRFMAQKGVHMLQDPLAIPAKTLNYAQYDLVRVLNQLMEALRVDESFIERVLAKMIAFPASRFLRMRRSVSLLVSPANGGETGSIVQGTYQSPILVQWQKAEAGRRRLAVELVRFR